MQIISRDFWIKRVDSRAPLFGNIGVCASVIRYAPGKVLIVSPVPFSPEDVRQIKDLGEVEWLVSPNPLHHLHLGAAKAVFPNAKIAGPAATAAKKPELKFDLILAGPGPWPWTEGVLTFRVPGRSPITEEFLFFHHPSKTLVVTDLLFNLKRPEGFLNWIALSANGLHGQLATSRLGKMTFKYATENRRVVSEILNLHPENLVVGHGEPIVGGAENRLHAAFAWLF